MGTARDPVVGSGACPPCTASVARCCFCSSAIPLLLCRRPSPAGPLCVQMKTARDRCDRGPPESFGFALLRSACPAHGLAWHAHTHVQQQNRAVAGYHLCQYRAAGLGSSTLASYVPE